jgi:hypothetical protein
MNNQSWLFKSTKVNAIFDFHFIQKKTIQTDKMQDLTLHSPSQGRRRRRERCGVIYPSLFASLSSLFFHFHASSSFTPKSKGEREGPQDIPVSQ